MTTPLDTFRNPPTIDPLAVVPLLPTGQPTFYGQSDVEGNVAFFNNIEAGTIDVDSNLIMPVGATILNTPVPLHTDGSPLPLTTLTQRLASPPAKIAIDGTGQFEILLPGAYFYNITFSLGSIAAAAPYLVTVTVLFNGSGVSSGQFYFPNTLTAPTISYSVNLFVFANQVPPQSGTQYLGVGTSITIATITGGQVTAVDGQINYLGNYSGNSAVHPT